MYTKCPNCQAIYRITSRQLSVAQGMVRCSQCDHMFNAQDEFTAVTPQNERLTASMTIESTQQDILEAATQLDNPSRSTRRTNSPQEPISISTIPSALHEDLAPVGKIKRYSSWATALWSVGILVLILALGAQIGFFHYDYLIRYPALDTVLSMAFEKVGYQPPVRHTAKSIEVVNRNVFTHPNQKQALMITATLVSNAPVAQSYPLMEVTLTDIQGRTVALRRFRPDEYLANPADVGGAMQPGAPVDIRLEVMDPGRHTMAFAFDFL